MAGPAETDPTLITADQVASRLAEDPALRAVAALCVLPMIWIEGSGVRFRRSDLDAWIAREHGRSRLRALNGTSPTDQHPDRDTLT